jgi:hypothetical protein
MTISENLDTFLADFGVPVIFDGETFVGVLDMPDQSIGSFAVSTEYSVLVKTVDISEENVESQDPITVDSIDYLVREYKRIDDGKFAKILLTKA